ncbi:class I SAM-dependent methyltransferase [Frankia sp. AiPs1]|uniref:class I SAM-dependent methyltransferase n=1 Tax=Frankia sp. AiPs1 TaxID=573493 RepID=UPI002044C6CD|nr:class I SAM-dependent methyltransferase [Frankia sp. AiPs1]
MATHVVAETATGATAGAAGIGSVDQEEHGAVRDSFAELAAIAAGDRAGDEPVGAGLAGSGLAESGPAGDDLAGGGFATTDLAGAGRGGTGSRFGLARQDDHALDVGDAAEPTLAPLLLHSLSDLREIWVPLIEASGARSVAEIGSESGVTTSLLVDLLRRGGGGRLVVVDPDPGVAPASGGGLDVQVIRGYSPQALDGHAPTDAYLIDGDHNYATVHGELTAIADAVARFSRSYFPLVVLHDVGWPAGRRDQYYNPDRVAADARQPHSWDVGVEIDDPGVVRGGFRGMGAFAWALTEGGPRNGVRTAIEDFVAEHSDLRFFTVAPIFGLGVVVDRRAPWARRIADLLTPWVSNRLLSRMERNRVDLYLHVLRLQDAAAAIARARQREWSRLDDERSRLAAVELEHLHRIGQLEHELADLRRREAEDAERAVHGHRAAADADAPRLRQVARIAGSALRSRLSPTGQERLARVQTRITDTGTGRTALPALRRRPSAPSRGRPNDPDAPLRG